MATDAFLQFPKPAAAGNIQLVGESLDTAFKGAIQITDFTLGAENATTVGTASGGAGVGKARLKEFVIKKKADKASGPLFQACCTGAHFPEAVLSVRKTSGSGKTGAAYLVYRLSMVFCTNVEWTGPADDGAEETVTFAYGALQVVYQPTDSTTGAAVGSASTINWNQVVNKPEYPAAGA